MAISTFHRGESRSFIRDLSGALLIFSVVIIIAVLSGLIIGGGASLCGGVGLGL